MKLYASISFVPALLMQACASVTTHAPKNNLPISGEEISEQHELLKANTQGKGYGPQSPRNIDSSMGSNSRLFNDSPAYTEMNLCNIHFHKGAEHKGGEFTEYVGNGDGYGYNTGYKYTGDLTDAELVPFSIETQHGDLSSGDTVEVHYVYSTAQVIPGPTLSSCLSDAISNPQLRVESQVYVLVHDSSARDFVELNKHDMRNGFHQAVNIPTNTGMPVQYAGSTTGPSYNEVGSPFQVSWSVRPNVAKVNIESVGLWLEHNVFNEKYAHAVRNLIANPELLSKID